MMTGVTQQSTTLLLLLLPSGTDTKYAVNGARTSKEVPADLEIPDVQAVIGASERI